MFRWTTWFTKYGGPTEHKWSNRTQVVQAERPRHDMRDTAPPCGTIGERNGVGRRNRPSSDAVGPFLAEMSAPLSRAAVGTAFSRAKYTPDARRRPGPDTATREDEPASRAQRCAGVRRVPRPARTSPWWTFSWARPADRDAAVVVVRLAAPLPGPAAARVVQSCCKGPGRAEMHEKKR